MSHDSWSLLRAGVPNDVDALRWIRDAVRRYRGVLRHIKSFHREAVPNDAYVRRRQGGRRVAARNHVACPLMSLNLNFFSVVRRALGLWASFCPYSSLFLGFTVFGHFIIERILIVAFIARELVPGRVVFRSGVMDGRWKRIIISEIYILVFTDSFS